MTEIALVGLDIAKNWFQAHAADGEGKPVLRRKLRRDQVAAFFAEMPPVSVGIEACSTSHHWARTIERLGHRVRLLPPQYVKPFVKRSKTDSADAEAICEAMRRSGIRDVAIKSPEQQAAPAVHRARDLLVRQRTMLTNAVRGFAAEFGIVSAKGAWHVPTLRERLHGAEPEELPAAAREVLQVLFRQFDDLDRRIEQLERQIMAWHRESEVSRRLATIPGIGPHQRDADRRDRPRRLPVQVGPRVRGLDRTGPARALERGQAEAGRHLEARQPLPDPARDRWTLRVRSGDLGGARDGRGTTTAGVPRGVQARGGGAGAHERDDDHRGGPRSSGCTRRC